MMCVGVFCDSACSRALEYFGEVGRRHRYRAGSESHNFTIFRNLQPRHILFVFGNLKHEGGLTL